MQSEEQPSRGVVYRGVVHRQFWGAASLLADLERGERVEFAGQSRVLVGQCLLPLESTPPWRETADEARADLAEQLREIAAGIMNQAEMVMANVLRQQANEEER